MFPHKKSPSYSVFNNMTVSADLQIYVGPEQRQVHSGHSAYNGKKETRIFSLLPPPPQPRKPSFWGASEVLQTIKTISY